MRRTKIVCTLGPSSSSSETIRSLILAGMDVARMNFSHGQHAHHEAVFHSVRAVSAELGRSVGILMDLQGPKIRTGTLEGGIAVRLVPGANLVVTTRKIVGTVACVSTTYDRLPQDVNKGDRILLADGVMELQVEKVVKQDVHCTVVRGGMLGESKGMNLPGVKVSAPSLTRKDLDDLQFGLRLGVDFVALSFVRSAADVVQLKDLIHQAGKATRVVAKIERPEAVACFDEILGETDAVMLARGDLGVELDLQDVPQIQKELIRKCNELGTPIITATQMLESMMTNARPTRAEVNDVANAIYDGTDAIMLSGETAAGQYPIESVQVMAEVAHKAETAVLAQPNRLLFQRVSDARYRKNSFSDAIGQAVGRMTDSTEAKRIVCLSKSGSTPMAISRYHPSVPITTITSRESTMRLCSLLWGVEAIQCAEMTSTDEMLKVVEDVLRERHLAVDGDVIVIVAGIPMGVGGRTNMLKLHKIGELG